MKTVDCSVFYRPTAPELAFLPEGPYPCGQDGLTWVAIQHGPNATWGSLNVLDLISGENRSVTLSGRAGFAFPTNRSGTFLIGMERRLFLFNIVSGRYSPLSDPVDTGIAGTMINDAVLFDGGLIFGCKDLAFREKKAGLYLRRNQSNQLVQLRSDQICSNGKVVLGTGDQVTLLDIDTPTKCVTSYTLDVAKGELKDERTAIDLTAEHAYPDGMIATPDAKSVIIAFYNPDEAEYGEVRQYGLESGQVETVWRLPGSPQATCPQLVKVGDQIKLIVTSAVEFMPVERQGKHPNAGCIFIGDTTFTELPETPVFAVS